MPHKQVVIIGGGFGGLTAAQSLRDADVVLIDRTNHHLFQPLLYQVATSALSPGDIAWPLRTIFRRHPHVRVVMDEVLSIDRAARLVRLRDSSADCVRRPHRGAWIDGTPISATMRGRSLRQGSRPSLMPCTFARRCCWHLRRPNDDESPPATGERLTFVIVGGGPTGVELAGALAEIGRKAMGPDFPNLRLDDLAILLVEGGSRILPGFSSDLSAKAAAALERKGVTIKLNSRVSEIRADGLMIGSEFIRSTNIIWAAGNKASPLLTSLGVPQDGSGRIKVQQDLTIPGDPWIFVIGDAAHCAGPDGNPLRDGSRRRAARPLCCEADSSGDRSGSAPAVCLRGSRHAGDHRTRTSRGADRLLAPIRTACLVAVVRGAYLFTDRVTQSRAGDVGMDMVLPHIQAGRKNHLI